MSKKVGRPRKTDLEAIKKPGKVGRPPGQAAAIKEFTARIINSPKSRKVMDAIVNAALDDDHKNQAAAWKLLMDRMVPLSAFDKGEGGARPTININISGVSDGQSTTVSEGETIEHDSDVSR
jgi:hypothetical protein